MASHTGKLLLATPNLRDPNFARSVVLVLDHDGDGALGVVINRPSELPLAAVLPLWADVVSTPQLLFAGGPVSPESALAVGLLSGADPGLGVKRLTSDFGLVDLDTSPDDLAPALVGLRVFSGYAGWGSDQLEREIVEGSWYVVNALPTDLLDPHPEGLWRTILRRQPGEMAYLATFPDDPDLN
jgi:putative transcriptional regulator